jgi:hypothetical protein
LGGDNLKRAIKTAGNKMFPNSGVLQGIPAVNPHEDFKKMDADYKKRLGAQTWS